MFEMTPEEDRPVGDAKRSYDTLLGDSSPVAHSPSPRPLPITKRPCTPSTRVVSLHFDESTKSCRDLDELWPEELIEMNGGGFTRAYDNTVTPSIDSG